MWPEMPKRLESALKGLCCLAASGEALQAREIAIQAGVPPAEMAKVLQLLVWGGFVQSRRGSKGGFRLTLPPDQIRTGQVIQFFIAKQNNVLEPESAVTRAFSDLSAPGRLAFEQLTLEQIATGSFSTSPTRERQV